MNFHADTVSTHFVLPKVLANYMRNKCSSRLPFHLQYHFESSAISLRFTNWKTLIQTTDWRFLYLSQKQLKARFVNSSNLVWRVQASSTKGNNWNFSSFFRSVPGDNQRPQSNPTVRLIYTPVCKALQDFQIQVLTRLCLPGFSSLSRPIYTFTCSKKHLTNIILLASIICFLRWGTLFERRDWPHNASLPYNKQIIHC